MTIREVRKALGKPVRFRSDRLHCDGTYILSGCTIRRRDGWFAYQAELLRDNHVIIADLNDIERIDPPPKRSDRQDADNAEDMLKGCICRMYVSDSEEEIHRMYESALYRIGMIADYGLHRLEEENNDD